MKSIALLAILFLAACGPGWDEPKECAFCTAWNRPATPFKIYGNTYYVGTAGLSAVLITSEHGHILIDGGLPQSAPLIAANIERLGFQLKDIRLIVNSHAHYDHAGGIAGLQRVSDAVVAASAEAARALQFGMVPADDPQFGFGEANNFPATGFVRVIEDGETLEAGDINLTMIATPGHTPGGMSWTWSSCEHGQCRTFVYADSLNAVSAPGYRFSDNLDLVTKFRNSIKRIAGLECHILLAPHPEFVSLREKYMRRQEHPAINPFYDPGACKTYAASASARLDKRLKDEELH